MIHQSSEKSGESKCRKLPGICDLFTRIPVSKEIASLFVAVEVAVPTCRCNAMTKISTELVMPARANPPGFISCHQPVLSLTTKFSLRSLSLLTPPLCVSYALNNKYDVKFYCECL